MNTGGIWLLGAKNTLGLWILEMRYQQFSSSQGSEGHCFRCKPATTAERIKMEHWLLIALKWRVVPRDDFMERTQLALIWDLFTP